MPARPPRRTAVLTEATPYTLHLGDCLEVLRTLPDASVDAVVTDPPYELGFMGKGWDASGIAFNTEVWRECLRVLKSGGHLLAFGGTRTYHRMTVAIEDAGFEIRDGLSWQYGSGFPKSLNVSIAIDKQAGAMGHRGRAITVAGYTSGRNLEVAKGAPEHEPITDGAKRWAGWGTALKPAWEPIVVARKPLVGTVAANVLAHGTGAMNIDGCRVPGEGNKTFERNAGERSREQYRTGTTAGAAIPSTLGRWPANLILSHGADCEDGACAPGCPCAVLDAQSEGASRYFNQLPIDADDLVPFLYVPKASRSEREAGCDALPARTGAEAVDRADKVRNHHPTVKPVSVMRWCIRLVTPPGGTVLDPFMGSGTTGIAAVREGVRFIGIERELEYIAIAKARIAHGART